MAQPEPLGPLLRRDDEPLFDEPWQAQLLGVAFSLIERGVFRAEDWSESLGANLARANAGGALDTSETYYDAVLLTLEQLTTAGGKVTAEGIAAREEEWRQAYLRTPHGKPVAL